MKNKLISILSVSALVLGLSACSTENKDSKPETEVKEPAVETFAAEYEMKGTTSSGKPKNDTFIFEGKTEDGIITELNFDIIRNKGSEGEYSKKDIMGYLMNISDAAVEKTADGYKLTTLTAYGYDPAYGEGSLAQFMVSASCDNLTDTTTFKELNFRDDALSSPDNAVEVAMDKALLAYGYLAKDGGIELNEETLVKDILSMHGLYADGSYQEGSKRISFAGYHGGRSYGEQMAAIETYILENKMTLEDVYEMFKTTNQASEPIEERDTISGATITFVGDFQRMVYLAIHGELFEGVVTHTTTDGSTKVEVVTQGYGGEMETHITFDAEGKITAINVRDAQETENVGGVLTAENSDFINALVAGQDDLSKVDAVSGATVTSNAMTKAVELAVEYYKGL